jgi:hypothetical protein
MAHGTLIGGTSYEIDGGRTLINGTGYDIDKGKTLVGGTGYEIPFTVDIVVNITGSGINGNYTKATIHGVTYSNVTSGIIVNPGDVIRLYVKSYYGNAYIQINGSTKASVNGRESYKDISYDWTVPEGITKIEIKFAYQSNSSYEYGTIRVTTS